MICLLMAFIITPPEQQPCQIIPPIQSGWVLTGTWAKKNPASYCDGAK